MSDSKEYFPALTGLRSIAAYMMFIHHYKNYYETFPVFIQKTLHEFYIGVEVFFVLSGFLIYKRYSNFIDFKQYFVSRFARIYPLYFCVLLFHYFYFGFPELKYFFLNLTLTKGFFEDYRFDGVAQSWTLTVEETFYFIAPLLFFLINKMNLKNVYFFMIIISLSIWIFSIKIMEISWFFVPFYTFPGRVTAFFAGIMVARNYVGNKNSGTTFFLTYSSLLLMIAILFAQGALANAQNLDYAFLSPLGLIIHNLLLPLAIAMHIYGLITEKTGWSSLLSSQTFQILGFSSYAFYLIHLGPLALIFLELFPDNIILRFLYFNLISIFLYFVVEKPLNQFAKSILSNSFENYRTFVRQNLN